MPRISSAPLELKFALCLLVSLGFGCSRQPANTTATLPEPAPVAAAAIAEYDRDGTGSLSVTEIAASPALMAVQEQFDADGDGAITRQEFEDRFAGYHQHGAVLMMVPCRITFGGRALGGAEVVFEPEPFMGNTATPARGTTAPDGSVSLQTEGQRVPGLCMGLYRIRISKKNREGRETIPDRYNTRSELGQEIALANRRLAGGIYLQLEAR